jgi:hypothetical protein
LQTLSNVAGLFSYPNLKSIAQSLGSPLISVAYGLVADVSKVANDVSSANLDGALTDVLKMPADLTNALLNGYVYVGPFNPTNSPERSVSRRQPPPPRRRWPRRRLRRRLPPSR